MIASVSNWGGYGLVAALSQITSKNLLPSVESETAMLRGMVDSGVVDGTTGEAVPTVDNFSAEENGALLARLQQAINRKEANLHNRLIIAVTSLQTQNVYVIRRLKIIK
ncbi:MAG: hypothetical protein Ct9H300mP11_06060 [Chloroflexota bacterium]|nr:MAG: hypothetical protein Ct9H300mP11_06060 [Chloroflexota bacterium]